MRNLFNLSLLLLFFTGCVGGVSRKKNQMDDYYEERQKSLDIVDLLDTLVKPGGLASWMQVTDIRQIDWKDDKPGYTDYNYKNPYGREGALHITTDNEFTYFVNGKRKKPVMWQIYLSGARGGYTHIVITTNFMTHEFSGFEYYFEKKGLLLSAQNIESDFSIPGVSVRKLAIKLKSQQITLVEEVSGGGTGGEITSLYLLSDGRDDNRMFPENIIKNTASLKKSNSPPPDSANKPLLAHSWKVISLTSKSGEQVKVGNYIMDMKLDGTASVYTNGRLEKSGTYIPNMDNKTLTFRYDNNKAEEFKIILLSSSKLILNSADGEIVFAPN